MQDNLPGATIGDYAHTAAKVGLSMIPFLGGPAAELFNLVIAPPMAKRRDQWLKDIAEELNALSRTVENFHVEKLVENDIFISTLLHASQIALRTHKKEKLEALRNAVINSITSNADDNLISFYLVMIETLAEWHIKVLDLFDNPPEWFERHNKPLPQLYSGSLLSVLGTAFNDIPQMVELIPKIVKNLSDNGLINISSISTTMTGRGLMDSRTTGLGKSFLKFIVNSNSE